MKYDINHFIQLISALRQPDTGCPWDLAQNYQSMIPCLTEETYEVIDAIEQGNFDNLKEELGDLLLQVVFFSQLASEENKFDFNDVIQTVSEKIIRRHPHVFAGNRANSAEEALQNWEKVKQTENQDKGHYSILDNVPQALPALMRAEKLQKKCKKVGFDWTHISDVIEKVEEELDEVKQELQQEPIQQEKLEEELGDLLFAIVNLTRHLKIKPETCLRKANAKFERRFRTLENIVTKQGNSLEQLSLFEMDLLWNQVKQTE